MIDQSTLRHRIVELLGVLRPDLVCQAHGKQQDLAIAKHLPPLDLLNCQLPSECSGHIRPTTAALRQLDFSQPGMNRIRGICICP
jgi:hypothetical protein